MLSGMCLIWKAHWRRFADSRTSIVDILVEAMHCDVDQPEQSDHLAIRIKQYLYRETLRPHLVDAVERLERGRQALGEHADRVFLWPSVREGRADALAAYDTLLARLRSYIDQLGGWYGGARNSNVMQAMAQGTPLPMSGSGFNVEQLHVILGCVARRDQEELNGRVGNLLGTLTADRHLAITGEIARVIEGMLITFR